MRCFTRSASIVHPRAKDRQPCEGRRSISCCLDHSAGNSVRGAMPMPCGSRPSMAALTRSGARKASEIVMLTLRTLQLSRFAMLSVVIDASVVGSSSGPREKQSNRPCRGVIHFITARWAPHSLYPPKPGRQIGPAFRRQFNAVEVADVERSRMNFVQTGRLRVAQPLHAFIEQIPAARDDKLS